MTKQALYIINKLREAGYQAVFAGGYPRDRILGQVSSDIDIATDAKPDMVESLFERTIPVGKAFGVIIVVIDDIEFEVATFRADHGATDGRRPDSVTFTSMEEDAKRRDLTINGMFYDPIADQTIDYVGGKQDLAAGIIRFIEGPEQRIAEDRLRMLRVVRFAARFRFKVDPATLEAVTKHAPEITGVSFERIAEELIKILRTHNFQIAFDLLFETGLIDHILPEIRDMEGVEQPVDYHPEGSVWCHSLLALEKLVKDAPDASDELLMGTLLHDVGKPSTKTQIPGDRIRFNRHELRGRDMAEAILTRLKFSNEFIARVVSLVEYHMKWMFVKEMRVAKLKRFMAIPHFDEHMALHRVDCLSSHGGLDNYEFVVDKLNTYEPEEIRPARIFTGHDLIALGLKPGPEFGSIIEDVEDRQLEGQIKTRDEALEYIRNTYAKGNVHA